MSAQASGAKRRFRETGAAAPQKWALTEHRLQQVFEGRCRAGCVVVRWNAKRVALRARELFGEGGVSKSAAFLSPSKNLTLNKSRNSLWERVQPERLELSTF